jgi:hypothetical protein
MKLIPEDIEKALRILRQWETAARLKGDVDAQNNVALLIKVIAGLTGRTK